MRPNPPAAFLHLARVALVAIVAAAPVASNAAEVSATRNGILVELFTSQGCGRCPAAEILFRTLDRVAPEAIPLVFHVDSADSPAWTDSLGSVEWTLRHAAYCDMIGEGRRPFLPQAVVGGRTTFPGSNRPDLASGVKAHIESVPMGGSFAIRATTSEAGIRASVRLTPTGRGKGRRAVLLALVENGLIVSIGGGENAGRTVGGNHVVRWMRKLGEIDSKGAARTFDVEIPANGAWRSDRLALVAFAQSPETMLCDAAATLVLPKTRAWKLATPEWPGDDLGVESEEDPAGEAPRPVPGGPAIPVPPPDLEGAAPR